MIPRADNIIEPEELSLLYDKEIINLKASAMNKIENLFVISRDAIKAAIFDSSLILPDAVDCGAGKISRGENYNGFPWMVLDFPKHFSKENIFAYRCIFLWGSHFSFTLQLNGGYLNRYRNVIMRNLNNLNDTDLFICINETMWEHDFTPENYLPLSSLGKAEIYTLLTEKSFVKISRKIPLKDWSKVPQTAAVTFRELAKLIRD